MRATHSVLFERREQIAPLTINRPEAMNALDPGVLSCLSRQPDRVRADPRIAAAIITGVDLLGQCATTEDFRIGTQAFVDKTRPVFVEHERQHQEVPMTEKTQARDFLAIAADQYPLGATEWRHGGDTRGRNVVIIVPATSVKARYYHRFAEYLFASGCDVVTFDYRGIGASRPADMRAIDASYLEWGRHDVEAILKHVVARYPGQPIDIVAHSIGGFTLGIAPSSHRVRRMLTVGAQIAYWPDYVLRKRLQMMLRWHLFMPLVAQLFGYFPGTRLGWIEDTPLGVVKQWSAFHRNFDRKPWKRHRNDPSLPLLFELFRGETLAISIADDEWGTRSAILRLLRLYTKAQKYHLHLAPADIGESEIGHFAYFNQKFADSLWPLALRWIQTGSMPDPFQSRILKVG